MRSTLSVEKTQELIAKAAAFDAIQANSQLRKTLTETQQQLNNNVTALNEVADFLYEVAGEFEDAQSLIDKYGLKPTVASEQQEA